MSSIFSLLASVVSLYTLLCFIRIILTWIPNASYSSFGRFLSSLCDPYLNLFRGIRWLQFSMLDFSSMLALFVLFGLSALFNHRATEQSLRLGFLIAKILLLLWQLVSSIMTVVIILLAIRLFVLLTNRDSYQYGSLWSQVDASINPLIFKMSSAFSGGKPVSFKKALIISIITLIFISFAGSYVVSILANALHALPF